MRFLLGTGSHPTSVGSDTKQTTYCDGRDKVELLVCTTQLRSPKVREHRTRILYADASNAKTSKCLLNAHYHNNEPVHTTDTAKGTIVRNNLFHIPIYDCVRD